MPIAEVDFARYIDWLPPVLMALGVFLLALILYLMLRGTNRRPSARISTHAEVLEQADRVRQEIEDAHARVAELIGTAQRLSARIEDKMDRLKDLINHADHQLAAAKNLFPAARNDNGTPHEPGGFSRHVETKQANSIIGQTDGSGDSLAAAVYSLADAGSSPVDIAGQLNEHVGKVELILALRRM